MIAVSAAAVPPPMTHPDANVLVDGFRTPLERVPENAQTMAEHMEHTLRAFSPRNKWHLWISDDIAMMMIRMDRIGRMDRRQRDESALRAEFFWDDDRRLLAEDVAARLPKDPARVVKRLRATPQGCDWLIERWGWLQMVLDAGQAWDEAQTAIVFDLLGIAAEFRKAAAARLADPAQLVRAEVAALETQKQRVAESDALQRSMAMTDMVEPNTAEYRQLKQFERRTHRRMKWALELLDLMPRFADAHPDFLEERGLKAAETGANPTPNPAPAPKAAPQPSPSPSRPQPWAASPPPPTPTPARRPDPAKLRAKTRGEAASRRREDRPDR